MNVIAQCLAALCASAAFGVLLRQPRDTLLHTSLIGLNGYIIYLLLNKGAMAFLVASLVVGLLCELTARLKERIAMIFLISATIPLVPGLGLYRTMIFLAEKNYPQALSTGMETVIGFGAIALALTISTTVFSNIRMPASHVSPKGDPHAPADLQ